MILNQDQNKNVNELTSEKKIEALPSEPLCEETDVPLFLTDNSDGQKCDAQDEKDKTQE